jgi:ribosome-binding factor A
MSKVKSANKETLDVLNKASGFLRHELSRRIKTRITPRLRFHYDKTNAYGNYSKRPLNPIPIF